MQSRRERLSSSRTIILKPVEWIGSCPVQHKSSGLENDHQSEVIALERVGWSLSQTGHEPIHQFPHGEIVPVHST